jgi:hypothetical protein
VTPIPPNTESPQPIHGRRIEQTRPGNRPQTDFMKKLNCIGSLILLSAVTVAQAQKGTLTFPHAPLPAPLPPVPVVWEDTHFQPPPWSAAHVAKPATGDVAVLDQSSTSQRAPLISPVQSQEIINRFKTAYPKLGSPRLLLAVNRELTNGQSLKFSEKQMLREVTREFGRPWRQADATLVNQKAAAALMAGKSFAEFIGSTSASTNREALGQLADVVIEVVVTAPPWTTPTAVGPNLQATAIRLSDSQILGQTTSAEATRNAPTAALANVTVAELAEATALALMQDLTTHP